MAQSSAPLCCSLFPSDRTPPSLLTSGRPCMLRITKSMALAFASPRGPAAYSAFNPASPQGIPNFPCLQPHTSSSLHPHFSTPHSSHLSKWLFHSYIFSDKNLVSSLGPFSHIHNQPPAHATRSTGRVHPISTTARHLLSVLV